MNDSMIDIFPLCMTESVQFHSFSHCFIHFRTVMSEIINKELGTDYADYTVALRTHYAKTVKSV